MPNPTNKRPGSFTFAASLNAETRAFSGQAYGGGVISDHPWWPEGVVFDLDSTELLGKVPTLYQHRHDEIAGHGQVKREGNLLRAEGTLYAGEPSADKIIGKAQKGFPWQMSINIVPKKVERLAEPATVNGQAVPAGVFVFRNSRVREVSFVAVGADHSTSANVFTIEVEDAPPAKPQETFQMTPEEIKALLKAQADQFAASLTAALTPLSAAVKTLTDSQASFSTRFEAMEKDSTARAKAERDVAVKQLFTRLGVASPTPEQTKPYQDMDATAFAATSALMNLTPVLPSDLTHQFGGNVDPPVSGAKALNGDQVKELGNLFGGNSSSALVS